MCTVYGQPQLDKVTLEIINQFMLLSEFMLLYYYPNEK